LGARGDDAMATRHLTDALRTFEQTEARLDVARTRLALADLARKNSAHAAAAHQEAARKLLAELGLTIFNSGGYLAWSPGARCAMPEA